MSKTTFGDISSASKKPKGYVNAHTLYLITLLITDFY